jgi:SAM-dependent methyltransferase
MKHLIKGLAAALKPMVEFMVALEARMAAAWCSSAFRRLRNVQWLIPPQPEHFDHRIDLYHQWRHARNPLWLERGVFSGLALKPGGRVLELACGDGFSARNFFSLRTREVIACDFDAKAIATARRYHGAPNVTYVLADIRTAMPTGEFDNVVWDAAIEHFTPAEIHQLLCEIAKRLGADGILSGYTIVERVDRIKSLSHHEYEFRDKADLAQFLRPYFRTVTVFETIYPDRHNLYFWASQGAVPFTATWPAVLHESAS